MPDRLAARPISAPALLFCLATAASLPVHAFDCAPLAPSASRAPPYRAVAGESRCEGFFDKKVSQAFIELVSLTRGPLPAPGTPVLELRADGGTAALLVIQPQRSGPFYRVDAALPAGQALKWDPAAMLAATGLRLADLGFLAVVNPAGPVLAPVVLAAPPAGGARVTAVVRVSVAVSSVSWRIYRQGPGTAPASGWTDLPNSQLFAWQRLAVPMDLPAGGGPLRVDVQAVGADDGRALPLLQFTLAGVADAAR